MDSLQISFRNFDPSEAAEQTVRRRAAELAQVFSRITSCRVVMESGRRGHDPGDLFHVHIDVVVPGNEIVVREANADLYAAIREAFDGARRRLQDHARRHEGR